MELLDTYGIRLSPVTLDQTKPKDDVIDIDFKDRDGKWVLRFRDKNQKFYQTRLGKLHNNMTQRGRKGGSGQAFHPSYCGVGVSEMFSNPQAFCEWAVAQVGWGLGYQLDKDLLGGRQYSEENCLFLPGTINTLISRKVVTPTKVANGWRVRCMVDGKVINNVFDKYDLATDAAIGVRKAYIRALAEEYRETIDQRAYTALCTFNPTLD